MGMDSSERVTATALRADAAVLMMLVGGARFALPLDAVMETFRPLAVVPFAEGPSWVRGATVVRGEMVPVVHLGRVLGNGSESVGTRFVLVRCGDRRVAIEVDTVLGVAALPRDALRALPPMLASSGGATIDAISMVDDALVVLLHAGRLIPPDRASGP